MTDDESIIERMGLEDALRQSMAGRIPEIQDVVDGDTVYCQPCDCELDFTPSVLQPHNARRHPEYDDD